MGPIKCRILAEILVFSPSLYPSLGVNKLLLFLLFLVFRNAENPLGKLLKGQPSVARNIYSFGFGKVRCSGLGFLIILEHFFQNLLFLTVIIPPVLFLTFSAFIFLLKRLGKKTGTAQISRPLVVVRPWFCLEQQKLLLNLTLGVPRGWFCFPHSSFPGKFRFWPWFLRFPGDVWADAALIQPQVVPGLAGICELLDFPFADALFQFWNFPFALFQFYLAGSGHLGYLASLPITGDKDVVQADDEPAFSYPVGPYMTMTK